MTARPGLLSPLPVAPSGQLLLNKRERDSCSSRGAGATASSYVEAGSSADSGLSCHRKDGSSFQLKSSIT